MPLAVYSHKNKRFCSKECRYQGQVERDTIKRVDSYTDKSISLVECKVCGLKAINLASHIMRLHMPVKRYYAEFNCGVESLSTADYLKEQSERIKGDKNPGYQHGGKLSVFSEANPNFKQENKDAALQKSSHSLKTNGNVTSTLAYWTKRGYDDETAKELLSERQTTFSLAICIEKYGEEEGKRRWTERQQKWLTNFPFSNFSQVSQELFWAVYEVTGTTYGDVYFAELDPATNSKDKSGTNHELVIKTTTMTVKPDFYVPSLSAVIEFDGDYWHDRRTRGNIHRDQERTDALETDGYHVLHIKEKDYRTNPQQAVTTCTHFLYDLTTTSTPN